MEEHAEQFVVFMDKVYSRSNDTEEIQRGRKMPSIGSITFERGTSRTRKIHMNFVRASGLNGVNIPLTRDQFKFLLHAP